MDNEFPGARIDESLIKHQHKKKLHSKIIKAILFHGIFYTAFTIGFALLLRNTDVGLRGSMVFALTYFLIYFGIKERAFQGG